MRVFLLLLFSLNVSAAISVDEPGASLNSGQSSVKIESQKEPALPDNLDFEAALLNSAVNDGTAAISVGFVGHFGRWVTVGARGHIPLFKSLKAEAQVYSLQPLARLNLINDLDNVFIEAFASINSGNKGDVDTGTLGAGVGYLRDFANSYKGGLNLGMHFAEGSSSSPDSEISLVVGRMF